MQDSPPTTPTSTTQTGQKQRWPANHTSEDEDKEYTEEDKMEDFDYREPDIELVEGEKDKEGDVENAESDRVNRAGEEGEENKWESDEENDDYNLQGFSEYWLTLSHIA